MEELRHTVEIVPNDAKARFYLAQALLEHGHARQAQKEYNRAVKRAPEVADSYWEWQELKPAIGARMVEEKRFDEAITYYDRLLEQIAARTDLKDSYAADPVVLYRSKADALAAKGDLDGAIAALHEALECTKQMREIGGGGWWYQGEAGVREALADLFDRKGDPEAAARERALAKAALRKSARATWRMSAPMMGTMLVGLTGVLQWLLALLYMLVAAITAAVWRRREPDTRLRKVRWHFPEVMGIYLIAFLAPLLAFPALAVAIGYFTDAMWTLFFLPLVGAGVTLTLHILLIRSRLAHKRWGVGTISPSATQAERWQAASAISGWLLLAAALAYVALVFAAGMVAWAIMRFLR